jgi:hypothetical protein
MYSYVCGVCSLPWHTQRDVQGGFSGQIWTEEVGYHMWQEPSKEQIRQRLRSRYGLT